MVKVTKPWRREVETVRGQTLRLALTPEGMYIWEKGRRKSFLLPYGQAYLYAVELEVDRIRREKKARVAAQKKARKAGR